LARRWRLIGLCLLVSVIGIASPQTVSAHAALQSSSPANGDVLATPPSTIEARFTEPLERSYSRMELYDRNGMRIEGASLSEGADDFTMTLTVPPNIPDGTYSVLWRTLSEADGHSAQNFFTFTVGTDANIATVVLPGSGVDDDAAPQWARTLSRWAALAGIALLTAAWPVWSTMIRPAVGPVRREGVAIARRMRRFVKVAVVLAIAGSVFALVVQSLTIPDGTLFDKVISTLGQTRYGHLWLVRLGLIAVLGMVLAACGWWFTRRRQVEGIAAWIVVAAMPVPFSLIAHASAQQAGRTFAVMADALHLAAASLWIGGLAMLFTVLLPGLRTISAEDRRRVLAIAIPRFSILGLIAVATLGITGFYAGWLQVGNVRALIGTDYGQALIVKLVLLVAVLAIAAVNLFVIQRKLTHRAGSGDASTTSAAIGSLWSRRLRWTVGGELALLIAVLVVVGQITSLQPARDVLTARSRQITVPFQADSGDSKLLVAPGIAGINHFRLEVDGTALPADTEALLRLTIPDRQDLGTKEIQLARVSGNAFEHHGSELGIADDWRITTIIREPGTAPMTAERTVTIGTTAPDVDVPGHPWRFETIGGVTGLVLILLGVAGFVIALAGQSRRTRQESGGLGVAALLLGIVLLVQARIDPALANAAGTDAIDPTNMAMVTRGEAIYASACLSCHGPELRGDGPAGAGMDPPPADFLQPHTMVHSEEDLIYWVRNGKQGTGMPAFGDTLSDQEMLDVLSYIEHRQQEMTAPATPTP
jgi:putative copper export protein/methionine-rich copper-binding protein CopC/mono/diheme cytochrome c family protein